VDVDGERRHRVRGEWLTLFGAVAGVVAALLYSSFVVASLFGSRLSPVDSLASELEVPGQPGSGPLRVLDAVCGVLIVVVAVALRYRLPRDRVGTAGCLFLGAFGVCVVLEARYPMVCTPSADRSCRRRIEQVPLLDQLHQAHAVFGSLAIFAVVMALLLLSASRGMRAWSPRLARACLVVCLLVSVLGVLEVVLIYVGHGVGVVERVYLLLISMWLAAVARPRPTGRARGSPADTGRQRLRLAK
jgi:hypothetical protein